MWCGVLPALRGGGACRAARSLPLPLCLRPSQCGTKLLAALPGIGRGAKGDVLTGLDLARKLGAEGEAAVGITGPKIGIRIPGSDTFRFPDNVTTTTLTEVKNVGYQAYTRQLRDYAAYANDTELTFQLYVRENTILSRNIEAARLRGDIVVYKDLPSR